jgi:hypothetical protein
MSWQMRSMESPDSHPLGSMKGMKKKGTHKGMDEGYRYAEV